MKRKNEESIEIEGAVDRIVERIIVNADPKRDPHGPCVVRAANSDILLSHQDSDQHEGGDGFAHQWRSTDNGFTWMDEGPAADWRSRNIDSLFGSYGVAPDGALVMMVQRRRLLGETPVLSRAGSRRAWITGKPGKRSVRSTIAMSTR